tara:strand:+ start:208 stop:501 length:294 start_codon:yes stop_codon:yes gene_type:complete
MKTKFKDLLLYTLATIGVVALFISATQTQVSHTTPESHEWELGFAEFQGAGNWARPYAINKKTGEVRKYNHSSLSESAYDKNGQLDWRRTKYVVMQK